MYVSKGENELEWEGEHEYGEMSEKEREKITNSNIQQKAWH